MRIKNLFKRKRKNSDNSTNQSSNLKTLENHVNKDPQHPATDLQDSGLPLQSGEVSQISSEPRQTQGEGGGNSESGQGREPVRFGTGEVIPLDTPDEPGLPEDGIPVFTGVKRKSAYDDIFAIARHA